MQVLQTIYLNVFYPMPVTINYAVLGSCPSNHGFNPGQPPTQSIVTNLFHTNIYIYIYLLNATQKAVDLFYLSSKSRVTKDLKWNVNTLSYLIMRRLSVFVCCWLMCYIVYVFVCPRLMCYIVYVAIYTLPAAESI